MEPVEGTRTFQVSGDAYDNYMGRYSRPLAPHFVEFCGVGPGSRVLDIGSGPGALTATLVDVCGAESVAAIDPAPAFAQACAARFPDVDVRVGRAEQIPASDASFDAALAQLVLHFVSDGEAVAGEMRRVVRPGGTVGACVWDFAEGMEMLRAFWDCALAIDPAAPDEALTMRFHRPGEIVDLFAGAGLTEIVEGTLHVAAHYRDFDELWTSITDGVGPSGSFCLALSDSQRDELREMLMARIGSPRGSFTLKAVARAARGVVPPDEY